MNNNTNRHVILALFNNIADENAFRPLLEGFPKLLSLSPPPDKNHFTGIMASAHMNPSLVILSSRFYHESRPELVAELRKQYPGADILLITLATDSLPPLQQVAKDRIRHLLVTPSDDEPEGISSQRTAINKLLVRSPWELRDYVRPGCLVHEYPLNSSRQKEALIAAVEDVIGGDSIDMELLRQRASLLADEMVENALYGAPQDHDGKKLYHKGEERSIAVDENIVFRFAFDGETLAMEIADGWGTLSPEMVVDFLSRNQEGMPMEEGEAGGRGLFIIWRFLDHLHVDIRPGQKTILGGHLKAASTLDFESPSGFSISTNYTSQ
ncbi:MAG TPA: ATP-binding protein [Desulfuromonadaceae bacterium]